MTRTDSYPGLFLNACSVVRSCRPAGLDLKRLATAFMNSPG